MELCDALTIRREDFLEFLKDHPDASISIIAMLSRRLRNTNDLIADTLFLDTPTRIAKKLMDLATDFGRKTDEGIIIDLRLRQQDMASMVGASRESVNRCLILLEQRGIIRLDKQRVTIVRPDDLNIWIAGPPPVSAP
ncbi:MAG: CRP-like cAMP-activated global transcriptional regulator [Nitrosomonadaceae bacterium]|nr:CRP-like cAMP-activated global transcriptional regulator [Nitrosomonadaceae bacterium]